MWRENGRGAEKKIRPIGLLRQRLSQEPRREEDIEKNVGLFRAASWVAVRGLVPNLITQQIPQNCIYPDLRKDDVSLRRFRRVLTNVDRKNSERESEEESRDCHAEAQIHALRSPEVVSFFCARPPAHIFASDVSQNTSESTQ